jgi:hypothetical protein
MKISRVVLFVGLVTLPLVSLNTQTQPSTAALPLGLIARAQKAHIGEPEISYHQWVSPDVDEYHEYHSHKPCAPVQMVKGHSPIAAGQNRFMLVTGIVAGGLTAWGVTETLESPTRL